MQKLVMPHKKAVSSVAFHPDGKTLATASEDYAVRIWDVGTGERQRCLSVSTRNSLEFQAVAYSPDGKIIAAAGNDCLAFWHANTTEVDAYENVTVTANALAFSPNGKLLVASTGGGFDVFGVNKRDVTDLEINHVCKWSVNTMTFTTNGQLMATAEDRKVRIWTVPAFKRMASIKTKYEVSSVAFSPDGLTLAFGGEDDHVHLWDVATAKERHVQHDHSHTDWITSVAFNPDGLTLASGSYDHGVRLWHVATGRALTVLHGHTGWVTSVAFSPNGLTLASASEDQTVRLWDVALPVLRLRGHFAADTPDEIVLDWAMENELLPMESRA